MPPKGKRASGETAGRPTAKKIKTAAGKAAAAGQLDDEVQNAAGLDGANPNTAAKPRGAREGPGSKPPEQTAATTDIEKKYLKAARIFENNIPAPMPPAFGHVGEAAFLAMVQPRALTPAEGMVWTDQHEQQLLLEWDADPLHRQIMAETDGSLKEHRVLWKSCCQFLR